LISASWIIGLAAGETVSGISSLRAASRCGVPSDHTTATDAVASAAYLKFLQHKSANSIQELQIEKRH
jgi:hypothetical protein